MSAGLQAASIAVTTAAVVVALINADRGFKAQARGSRIDARRTAAYLAIEWLSGSSVAFRSWLPDPISIVKRPPPRDVRKAQGDAALEAYHDVHARLAFVLGPSSGLRAVGEAHVVLAEAVEVLSSPIPFGHHRAVEDITRDWDRCVRAAYNALADDCDLDTDRWAEPEGASAQADEPPA